MQVCRIGFLGTRLGACLTGPSKRMVVDLDDLAHTLNRIRNDVVDLWERSHTDNSWTEFCPPELKAASLQLSRQVAPHIAPSIRRAAVEDVLTALQKRLPPKHRRAFPDSECIYRWEGILKYEWRLPLFTYQTIPVSAQETSLEIDSNGEALASFTLFSKQSGRKNRVVTCRIRPKKDGQKKVLCRLAEGHWFLRDSRIKNFKKSKKKNEWVFVVSYRQRSCDLELAQENVAVLSSNELDAFAPFTLYCERDKRKKWNDVGRQVGFYRNRAEQVTLRREALSRKNDDYRNYKRYKAALIPIRERFEASVVREVKIFCEKHDCGRVRLALSKDWFEKYICPRDSEFDLGGLKAQLNKLFAFGIKVE